MPNHHVTNGHARQGVQNNIVSISCNNIIIRLFGLYLSSFFRLLHIHYCKYNCKILWYSYMWHSRDTRFQMNTRQYLKPNEHNQTNSRTALSNSYPYSYYSWRRPRGRRVPKHHVTNGYARRAKQCCQHQSR